MRLLSKSAKLFLHFANSDITKLASKNIINNLKCKGRGIDRAGGQKMHESDQVVWRDLAVWRAKKLF